MNSVSLLADLEEFVTNHRSPRPPDRRRHEARVERLLAHGGVLVWSGVERWVTPEEADADLLRLASLN